MSSIGEMYSILASVKSYMHVNELHYIYIYMMYDEKSLEPWDRKLLRVK